MKKGWIVKKLGEVCESDLGKTINKSKDKGRFYPYLCSINVLWNAFDFSTIKEAKFEETELDKYSVSKGDLLICEGGDIGRAAIWNFDNTILYQNALHRVRCYDNLNSMFCLYYLKYLKEKGILDSKYAKGVTIKHLVKSALLSIPIPIPPLSEQHRIVSELDCLNGIIDKKREQLKELNALAQSIFYDMFGDPIMNEKGWERIQINDCVIEMFIGPFGSSLKKECYVNKEDAYCMVYEQKHAINKRFDLENHYIDKDKYIELKRFEVGPSDFIMSCRGTIGEIYQIPSTAPKGIIHPSLMKIRLNDKVCNPIFFEKILAIIVKGQDMKGGCIKMAITAKSLGKILIIIPPMELQNLFAEKISAIDKQKELIKQSLAEVENLFNSRLDYYFH